MKASHSFMQTLSSLYVTESLKYSSSDHITPCLWPGIQVFCPLHRGLVCQILVSHWRLLRQHQILSGLSLSAVAGACCFSLLMQHIRVCCKHSWLWGQFDLIHHITGQFFWPTDLQSVHQLFGLCQSPLTRSCWRWRGLTLSSEDCHTIPTVSQVQSSFCSCDLMASK